MANSGMAIDDLVINIRVNTEGATTAINRLAGSLGAVQGSANEAKDGMSAFADSEEQAGERGGFADSLIRKVAKSVKQAGKEAKKSSGFFGGLIRTIGRIAMYRLIRSAIRGVTTAFTEGTKTFIEWDKTYNNRMAGAADAVDRIKAKWNELKKAIGAFSGVFITAVEPVLQKIMDAVINIFNFMQQAIRALQGEATWYRAVYKEAKNTTKEAQKLQRVLFGFDELNVLPSKNKASDSSSAGKWDYVEEMIPKENPFVEAGKFYGSDKPIEKFFLAAAFTARNIISWVGEHITKPIIDWVRQNIVPWVKNAVGGVWNALKTVWDAGKESFVNAFNWVKEIAVNVWDGIKSVWGTVKDWFKNNVAEPLKAVFGPAWEKIKAFFNDPIGSIKKAWVAVKDWFRDNVTVPIKDKYEWLRDKIKNALSGPIAAIKQVWIAVRDWFRDNITVPLKDKFEWLKGKITAFFSDPISSIKKAWQNLKTWFSDNVATPIKDKFSWLKGKINAFMADPVGAIKEAWKNLKTWFKEKVTDPIKKAWESVTKVFGEGGVNFQAIKDGIKNAFKSAINTLIGGINSVIRKPLEKVNDIIKDIRNADIFGWQPFKNLKTISIPQIPLLQMAEGGVIRNGVGTLFQAGEAGPEVVANLGTHTGVMNAGQMQEAVAEGNVEVVNAIYAVLNALNAKDTNIYLDSRKIGESVTKYQSNQARRGIAQGI